MKISFVLMLAASCLAGLSCSRTVPADAPARFARQDVCENRSAEACWNWAQTLEENGDERMLQVLEGACAKGSPHACRRFLDEAELSLFPSPGPAADAWKPRLETFCSHGEARACRLLDMLHLSEPKPEPEKMKKAFFNRLEACRKDNTQCVALVQALSILERKNAPMFKANALSALQTACEGGAAEACHQEPLLQTEKRNPRWTLPFLLRACSLGETAGCSQLVSFSRRALIENMPHYDEAAPFLEKACFEMDFRAACLAWAKGHVYKIWPQADEAAGRNELLRQCRLGDNESCTEFARVLRLSGKTDESAWALQILRQACSDSHMDACVEWILATEKGTPEEHRSALLQARVSCMGTDTARAPSYEHEYMQESFGGNSTYNNPACAVFGRLLLESDPDGFAVTGKGLLIRGCSSLAHPACLYYGKVLMTEASSTAGALTSLYERICKAGHASACLEMAALQRRGFKELKPNEAAARDYTALACRLDPRLPVCASR